MCVFFDKLIIERETWAAEFLRLWAKVWSMYRDFGGLYVSRNTPLGRRETFFGLRGSSSNVVTFAGLKAQYFNLRV